MNKLSVLNVSKSYQGTKTIEDITINMLEGSFVSIVGTSGVGKTTLFNIISAIEKPDEGRVFIDGHDCTGVLGKVSYMQQNHLLLPFKTVIDNVCIPLKLKGVCSKKARAEAILHFDEFGLAGCKNKYPSQISGGMKQRAAFLRSYLFKSDIMLLDEPFSALDAITKQSMHNWYKNIAQKHNISTLFITHDVSEAVMLSDKIYVMSGTPGKIIRQIDVAYSSERNNNFLLSDKFNSYRHEVIRYL